VVAGALLLALPGCARAPAARPPALEATGKPYSVHIVLRSPQSVLIYGVRKFRVLRPVTLRSFAPAVLPQGVTVLAARAVFLRSAHGRLTTRGYPGAFCTDTWPMAGFGPTYDVAGLTVEADDVVAFTLYVRLSGAGQFAADGYDLKYDDAGVRSLGEESGDRAEVRVLGPGETDDTACDGSIPDIWMKPPPSPPGP
jgi:hypothetical protein